MKLSQLIEELEQISPNRYACSWDNVGLLVGRKEQQIQKVVVSLDATNEVIEQAIKHGEDLILTHHPMIFSSMKCVNDDSFLGRKILNLIENKIACYAMHTNFDIMGGMAQLAEKAMNLQNATPLEVIVEENGSLEGIGRVGQLEREMTLLECADFVKSVFNIPSVSICGEKDKKVKTVAICPGSGKGMAKEARKKGAEVLIAGDFGHHDGMDALDDKFALIDAGHYGIEHIFMEYMTKCLKETFPTLEVIPVDSHCPFTIV